MGRELLAGWGRTAATVADVIQPAGSDDVCETLAAAPRRGVIARGLGRSYGDVAQNAGGTVISTTRLDGWSWVDEGRGEVRAGGGTSLDALMRAVVPAGWFLPVTPGTRHVTVGGAIAADIHGKNHHRDGSFGRYVTSVVLAVPTGVVTVTPASDPGLFWATLGGLGLTGVILEATVCLVPIVTSAVRVVTERGRDLDDVMARMDAGDDAHRYSVAWIDALAPARALGRGVITWGDHAEVDDIAPRNGADPLAFDPGDGLAVPAGVPGGVLNGATVRAFNEWWFRRSPSATTVTVEPLTRFFHPLDALVGWNRLYGRRGFLQYQFVVPFGAAEAVRTALEWLRAVRCPSFLTVLKRMGEGDPGPLSFPRPGWTLALDIPQRTASLSQVLDDLDGEVAAAGGRVYLAKDARLRPDLLGAMYPELDLWRRVKQRVDPDGVFTSDLARRLGLVGAGASHGVRATQAGA